jgi:hypothetical protein
MASVEIIVRDDQGKIIRQVIDDQVILAELSLDGVEEAVERRRHTAAKEVSASLLGHRPVVVKTLHGSFKFTQQMYQAIDDEPVGFLTLSGKRGYGYVSRGLQELVTYYSNRLSYEELRALVVRKKKKATVVNDVMLLEIQPGKFEYLFPPIEPNGNYRLSLESMLRQRIRHHYASSTKPLPIIAICDGAKVIRQRLYRVFGKDVWIILDWYHLDDKVYQLMSMIGRSKEEKATHSAAILGFLWEGKTTEAIDYLSNQVVARNVDKYQELIGYLEKHRMKSLIISVAKRRVNRLAVAGWKKP